MLEIILAKSIVGFIAIRKLEETQVVEAIKIQAINEYLLNIQP